jgi:hypothetical protein
VSPSHRAANRAEAAGETLSLQLMPNLNGADAALGGARSHVLTMGPEQSRLAWARSSLRKRARSNDAAPKSSGLR